MARALLKTLGPRFETAADDTHRLYADECAALSADLPEMRIEPIPVQIYHCLPWLFAEIFPAAREEDFRCVAASGLLYFAHVLTLDRSVDGDRPLAGAELLVGSAMHERALTMLFPRLPRDTSAWDHLARYGREYARAVLKEKAFCDARRPFTWEQFVEIGAGKAAILKASPAMIASMCGAEELIPRVDAMLEPFNVANQVQDDLEDWRRDYQAGRYSYLLTRALEEHGTPPSAGADRPTEEEIGHTLFYSDVAVETVDRAIECCALSIDRGRELGAEGWIRFASLFRARLEQVSAGFRRIRAKGLVTLERGPTPEAVGEALGRMAERLAEQHARGYPEARHSMRFPHRLGFTGEEEVQHGEVFPRAVLGWSYNLLAHAGHPLPDALVEANRDALLALRLPGQRGGWSYFPTLPELAPDSDDLAQVIHALAPRPGDWRAAVRDAVDLVLERHLHDDGSVDTWIVDPELPADRQLRYRDAIDRHWGRGVDPEVVANFFSALRQLDAERYALLARRAAGFVAGCQGADGSWSSTWYVGPYYGSFVCARLLRECDPGHPALQRAADFVIRTQRPDGGWGSGDRSDPLSTALAVLALKEAGGEQQAAGSALRNGIRHLLLVQREDGLWPRTDFIRMDLNRAVPGAPARFVTYGSATMSAAFAAVALVEARHALEGA